MAEVGQNFSRASLWFPDADTLTESRDGERRVMKLPDIIMESCCIGEVRSMTFGEEMLPHGYSDLLLVVTRLVIKCLLSPTVKPQSQ